MCTYDERVSCVLHYLSLPACWTGHLLRPIWPRLSSGQTSTPFASEVPLRSSNIHTLLRGFFFTLYRLIQHTTRLFSLPDISFKHFCPPCLPALLTHFAGRHEKNHSFVVNERRHANMQTSPTANLQPFLRVFSEHDGNVLLAEGLAIAGFFASCGLEPFPRSSSVSASQSAEGSVVVISTAALADLCSRGVYA